MEEDYKKAYREVYEILITLPKDDVNKIPKDMREMLEKKMDREYNFKVYTDKTFEEQNFSEITKSIIANLYRDYWATTNERKQIIKNQNIQRSILERQKKLKYSSDDIFKNRNVDKVSDDKIGNINLPIEVKNKTFFESFMNFIKRIFKL